MAKLPGPPPPEQLRAVPPDLVRVDEGTPLLRVHDTVGEHVLPWNRLRHFGPVARCRFDPHEPPPHEQDAAVTYHALDLQTVLAERFQDTRVVNRRRGSPYLTVFLPARPLQLLELTGTWPIRAGASPAMNTGRRDVCRAWARAVVAAWPQLDGLWHASAMTGRSCVTLFAPAQDALPKRPILSEPLSHPGLLAWMAEAGERIGYWLL